MWSRIRSRLTYANVMATVAVFITLGGGAYAAVKLPRNSVGTGQLKRNAVDSSKVRDASLLARDFKRGQLTPGPRGLQGLKGDAGAAGPAGPQGATGSRGPGTQSFDGQFDNDGVAHTVSTVDGLQLLIVCSDTTSNIQLRVLGLDPGKQLYAWGTAFASGTLSPASLFSGPPTFAFASGPDVVNLDVTATADVAGVPVRYTRIDASGVRGSKCSYHALIIPSQ